jgi:hypothetical protein
MLIVYQACAKDKGAGVTKRSIGRIRNVLSDMGPKSPFASLSRVTANRLSLKDKFHIGDVLGKSISSILDEFYETVNGALQDKVEDETELAVRADLQQFLPALLTARDQVDKDLQAVMARHGLQPRSE